MRKDIFIDNNIAKNFSNPLDPEYKLLVSWLQENVPGENQAAHLVVSNKLLAEYHKSSRNATSSSSIPVIIDILTRQNRLIKISNEEIKNFRKEYFSKKVERELLSNEEDRNHIPVVLLSDRKFALTIDHNLTHDLLHFPGFHATVEARPERLPYAS